MNVDTQTNNLLFLLGAATLLIPGCGDDGASDPEPTATMGQTTGATTANPTTAEPTGTPTTADPTGQPTTSTPTTGPDSGPTTGEEPGDESSTTMSGDPTTGDDPADPSEGPDEPPSDAEAACQAYAEVVVGCFPGAGYTVEQEAANCVETLAYFDADTPECGAALLEYYACLGTLDCKGLANKRVGCAEEIAAVEAACPASDTDDDGDSQGGDEPEPPPPSP